MAVIEIVRGGCWNDRLRAYEVWIDGEMAGEIRANRTERFEVAPGAHRVQLKIDWAGSPPLEVTAGDAPVRLSCGAGFHPLLTIIALFQPGKWIRLERA